MPKGLKGFQKGHGSFWSAKNKEDAQKRLVGEGNPFFGKKHSEEVKRRWSEMKKGKHFSPATEFKKGDNAGENHPLWKGDDVKYGAVHSWIYRHFGKPNKCEECGKIAYKNKMHWANISGKYKRDRSDWKRLCTSCHYKMDDIANRGWITRRKNNA